MAPRQQAAHREEPPYSGDTPVGEILRRTRLQYGQSIADVERSLRIRAVQIDAIENGRYELLPGPVYTVGFIRSYAVYLGLDGDNIVSLFKSQSGVQAARPELNFPVPASESKLPQAWLMAGSMAAAVVILTLWWAMSSHDRTVVTEVPSFQTASKQGESMGPPAPKMTVQTEGAQTVSATDASKGIILKITQNSWVEIKDADGKEVVSRVLKEGDRYFVPDRPDLFMSLGNSGGVKIEIDGKELSAIGQPGEVLRNMPLDITFLKKKFSK